MRPLFTPDDVHASSDGGGPRSEILHRGAYGNHEKYGKIFCAPEMQRHTSTVPHVHPVQVHTTKIEANHLIAWFFFFLFMWVCMRLRGCKNVSLHPEYT